MNLLQDGEYSVELYHTFMKTVNFLSMTISLEMTNPDPYFTTPATVKGDTITLLGVELKYMDNPHFRMEFFFRGRLVATNDIIIFRMTKGGGSNAGF